VRRTAASRLLALAVVLLAGATSRAETLDIRLLANRPVDQVRLTAPGWVVYGADGRAMPADDCTIRLTASGRDSRCRGQLLSAPPLRLEPGADAPPVVLHIGNEKRRYIGHLRFEVQRDRLVPLLTTDLEDYVTGVLGAEADDDAPEYLKALAVVIRSFAVSEQTRHAGPLADDTRRQSFRGLPEASRLDRLRSAAQETAGRVLRIAGRVVPAFFHACCGGYTRAAAQVFTELGDVPHLRGVADADADGRPWCAASRWFTWTRTIEKDRWQEFLRRRFQADAARRKTDESAVTLLNASGSRTLGAWSFRIRLGRTLGWNTAPSDRFAIEESDGQILLTGHGFGHRVGLCQAGALAQARSGRTATEILAFYFPGISMVSPI
jgi:stage II sporulation protein D